MLIDDVFFKLTPIKVKTNLFRLLQIHFNGDINIAQNKFREDFMKEKELTYQAPKLITYSEDEIIELLGPAQTCSPSPCPTYR